MDTSDESVVASFSGALRDVPGGRNLVKADPFLRKPLARQKKKEDEEEERERVAAAGLAEEKRTVTAEPLPQQTELERRNRRRRASVLTRNFDQVTLGRTGLLSGARV